MISQEEARQRWQNTLERASSLSSLRNAVKGPLDSSICTSGLRSLCWKTFLLFRETGQQKWASSTRDSRAAYSSLRGHFMKYVEHPELLQAADPLNDDAESPWVTLRKDEELRQEILQDVDRCMPDEPYFRQPSTQALLTDILFVYCKINEDIGYRQGMHEILAPVLWVVEKDALSVSNPDSVGNLMEEVLNSTYIEHDSFTLFSLIMRTAKSFYELSEPEKVSTLSSPSPQVVSPIEQRSKRIHEVMLARLDPELAAHLTQIEILPQIFLIRWIRLLFGREFPFETLLQLWDVLFAVDPDLELIDFICAAMLLRIRWQLIEADYSQALILLLKYPIPEAESGPQAFVEDAIFLRTNMNASGGGRLIAKYSGRVPPEPDSRPAPPRLSSHLLESRRSPLPSPASFLRQQGGMEAILQGAAKNIIDRGERLGVNQALRDAADEVRKNLQGLSPSPGVSRRASENQTWRIDDRRHPPAVAKALVALEARNRKLGELLSEVTHSLYTLSTSFESKNGEINESMSLAIRQLAMIKDCLNDSKLSLPPLSPLRDSHERTESLNRIFTPPAAAFEDVLNKRLRDPSSFDLEDYDHASADRIALERRDSQRATNELHSNLPQNTTSSAGTGDGPSSPSRGDLEPESSPTKPARPPAMIPTRSSLAQSSFAWMLEPGEEPQSAKALPASSTRPFSSSGKKVVLRHGRERSSYLFGEETDIPLDDAGRDEINNDPLNASGTEKKE